jgi:hypothetical protein
LIFDGSKFSENNALDHFAKQKQTTITKINQNLKSENIFSSFPLNQSGQN